MAKTFAKIGDKLSFQTGLADPDDNCLVLLATTYFGTPFMLLEDTDDGPSWAGAIDMGDGEWAYATDAVAPWRSDMFLAIQDITREVSRREAEFNTLVELFEFTVSVGFHPLHTVQDMLNFDLRVKEIKDGPTGPGTVIVALGTRKDAKEWMDSIYDPNTRLSYKLVEDLYETLEAGE